MEAASPWPSPLHSFKQCRDFRVAVLVTVVLLGLAAEPIPPILLHTTSILTDPGIVQRAVAVPAGEHPHGLGRLAVSAPRLPEAASRWPIKAASDVGTRGDANDRALRGPVRTEGFGLLQHGLGGFFLQIGRVALR